MATEIPGDDPPPPEYDFPPDARPTKPLRKARVTKIKGNGEDPDAPEYQPQPAMFGDDFLAEQWVLRWGEDWRYVHPWAQWLRWDGKTWRRVKGNLHFEHARDITRQALSWPGAGELTAGGRRALNSASTAAAMLHFVRAAPTIEATVEQWDADPWALATPAGVVDLRLGKLVEASREQYCTRSTSVAPEPGAPELWLSCLDQWFGGDDALIRYWQLFCGYSSTGDCREKMFAFVHGPADTGKSVAINTIAAVLGSYAQSASMDTFTESKHERHTTELAELAGARFVYAPETEEGHRWNQARINQITGKDRVRARFMRQDNFEYAPQFKLCIYGNHAPMLKQVDSAMRRRLHILPFAHSIPRDEQDPLLDEKLKREHARILTWIIQGAVMWQESGLTMPEAITEATESYLEAQDSFGDWVEEKLIRDPTARCTSAEAYKSYRDFCDSEGDSALGQKRFAQQMEQRGFTRKKSNGQRIFNGCRLRQISDI